MYRRNAGQLWRVTGDLRVESKLIDHCYSELSEDSNRCFDGDGMLARHVSPVGMKSVYHATCNCLREIEGDRNLTSQ